jgi:flagellar biosynthesis/type III secretory pathway protein FliH
LYNLIKRALVTIDENEKVRLYKKEKQSGVPDENKKKNTHDLGDGTVLQEDSQVEMSPAVSLAREKARVIIEEAEKEAEQIKETAKKFEAEHEKKAKQLLTNAEKEIKSKEEQIKKEWDNRFKTSIKSLNDAKNQLEKSKEEYIEITSEKLRLLLKTLIQRVLFLSLEENREQVMAKKITEMINRVMSLKEIVFKFNPSDIKVIPDEIKREMEETLSSFEIRQDASISKGGVIVETNYGTLDGTMENQLEIIDDMIEQVFGEEE